jgi:membrane-associated protease RseP (regulator of RpoE activity)
MCDAATTHPHVGGNIYLWWNNGYYTSGEFLKLTSHQEVAFSWLGRTDPGPTRVDVALTSEQGATHIKLVHSGLGEGESWVKAAEQFRKGWEICLENLVHTLERGPDLRITTRPMMGINLDDFNENVAQELGVPVSQGVRIANAIDGMGAQAAGLQKGDVIIDISGQEVIDFASLTSAMQGRRAGEVVEMTVYRGPDKMKFSMTLSRRAMPEVPPTAEGLAAEVQPLYANISSDLDAFLSGVTDEEASRKPGPSQWSIKGVLAHLIHSERGWQNAMGELIGGAEASYDDYGENVEVRINATIAANPTLDEMWTALKRLFVESQAMIANLPEDFVARKASYWRLGYQALMINYHFQDHLQQMKDALQVIRA